MHVLESISMCGAVGNFFIYLLVMWSVSNSLAGLFRLFAYASPTS
jgi:hypothetical protein